MYEQSATMGKQMIDLQRIGMEGMISYAIAFWDQTGSMINWFLSQAVWVPEEGKRVFREWIDTNKKGCETFKDAVNNGYLNLERMFGAA